jgi:hypothetical protein
MGGTKKLSTNIHSYNFNDIVFVQNKIFFITYSGEWAIWIFCRNCLFCTSLLIEKQLSFLYSLSIKLLTSYFTCHVDTEYRVPLLCHLELNSILLHGKFLLHCYLVMLTLPLFIYVICFLSCRFAHGEDTLLSLTLFQCMHYCA